MSLELKLMRVQKFTRRRRSYGMTRRFQEESLLKVNKFSFLIHATKVFPHRAVEVENNKGERFNVNGQRLKAYFEGDFRDELLYFDVP